MQLMSLSRHSYFGLTRGMQGFNQMALQTGPILQKVFGKVIPGHSQLQLELHRHNYSSKVNALQLFQQQTVILMMSSFLALLPPLPTPAGWTRPLSPTSPPLHSQRAACRMLSCPSVFPTRPIHAFLTGFLFQIWERPCIGYPSALSIEG